MTKPGETGRVRASDSEREEYAQILRAAMAEGRLTMEIGEERLGQAYGATYRDELAPLIADLPRDQAEAIMLRTVLGYDAPTAARILGKRPGAVRAASYRGLKQLAKKLTADP